VGLIKEPIVLARTRFKSGCSFINLDIGQTMNNKVRIILNGHQGNVDKNVVGQRQ